MAPRPGAHIRSECLEIHEQVFEIGPVLRTAPVELMEAAFDDDVPIVPLVRTTVPPGVEENARCRRECP